MTTEPTIGPDSAQPQRNLFVHVGFGERLLAYIVDQVLLSLILTPILIMVFGSQYMALFALDADPEAALANINLGLYFLIAGVGPMALIIFFWRRFASTPGKMIFKARVVDARTGAIPGFGQCLARYVGYIISSLPLGLGFIWILIDEKNRAWHDLISGTVVVKPYPGNTPQAVVRHPDETVSPGGRDPGSRDSEQTINKEM